MEIFTTTTITLFSAANYQEHFSFFASQKKVSHHMLCSHYATLSYTAISSIALHL
jgi:integral membrane sensor domain MASE1